MEKMNFNKVSDNFQLCRHFLNIVYEEIERVAWDLFLKERETETNEVLNSLMGKEMKLILLVEGYIKFLNEEGNSKDERRVYMSRFILIAKKI